MAQIHCLLQQLNPCLRHLSPSCSRQKLRHPPRNIKNSFSHHKSDSEKEIGSREEGNDEQTEGNEGNVEVFILLKNMHECLMTPHHEQYPLLGVKQR